MQGAIIIVGVLGLVDIPEFIYLWRINKLDFLVWNVAFLFTIFLVGGSTLWRAGSGCQAAEFRWLVGG